MKVIKPYIRFFSVAAFAIVSPISLASDFVNGEPIFKDVTASNAGIEMIVPLIRAIDTDGDDYPNRFRMEFRVMDPDTNTRVYGNTRARAENVPPIPCTNPISADWEWELEFLGEENSHTGILAVFYVECQESNGGTFNERVNTYLYVADTSSANGDSWMRRWGLDAASAVITDWDADADEEVAIVLIEETDTREIGRFQFLDKETGAQEFNERYTVTQF